MNDYIVEGCFYITDKNDIHQIVNFDYVIKAKDKYEAQEDVREMLLDNGIETYKEEVDVYERNADGSKGDRCEIFRNRNKISVNYKKNLNDEWQAEVFENEEEAYEHFEYIKKNHKFANMH
jgi:antitoxin component HigA of HigAB toxin-antitoxin module